MATARPAIIKRIQRARKNINNLENDVFGCFFVLLLIFQLRISFLGGFFLVLEGRLQELQGFMLDVGEFLVGTLLCEL